MSKRNTMSKQIEILCPQTGLVKKVSVCEEQSIGSLMGQLGYAGQTLYVGDHALDPESTFVGRPQDPSLFGEDPTEVEPYRLGGIQ
jgi:hypothetical protein